jgi:hypothetical protein
MSSIRKSSRLLIVAVCCVALGAGASVLASAGAATTGPSHTAAGKSSRARGLRGLARRAVHGTVVVHTKAGFANVTFDRGKVDSLSGRQVTITEGTAKASYKTVTLTIPATARVRVDRKPASLSGVKPGQRVLVLVAPKRTFVIARTPPAG